MIVSYRKAIIIIILLILVPVSGFSKTFSIGFNKYVRGDFVGSEEALNKALKKAKSSNEKARIYKFLGINQFMLGRKKEASESFVKSIRLNTKTAIHIHEVLDEKVITFFNRRKAKILGKNSTLLLVKANTKKGSIYVDGEFMGKVGEEVRIEKNTKYITVQAKGYHTKKIKLNVVSSTKHVVIIELKRKRRSKSKKGSDIDEYLAEVDRKERAKEEKKPNLPEGFAPSKEEVEIFYSKSQKATSKNWLYLLPFGVGQYKNNSPVLGGLFSVTQAYFLYSTYTNFSDEDQAFRNAQKILASDSISDERKETFKNNTEKFMADRRKEANMSIGAFFGLWTIGVIHAFLNKDDIETADLTHNTPTYAWQKNVDPGFQFRLVFDGASREQPHFGLLSLSYRY